MAEKYAIALWLKTGRQNTQTSANPSFTIALMLIIYLCAARNTWSDLRSPKLGKNKARWSMELSTEHFQVIVGVDFASTCRHSKTQHVLFL